MKVGRRKFSSEPRGRVGPGMEVDTHVRGLVERWGVLPVFIDRPDRLLSLASEGDAVVGLGIE